MTTTSSEEASANVDDDEDDGGSGDDGHNDVATTMNPGLGKVTPKRACEQRRLPTPEHEIARILEGMSGLKLNYVAPVRLIFLRRGRFETGSQSLGE
jgi:hypothetical protein